MSSSISCYGGNTSGPYEHGESDQAVVCADCLCHGHARGHPVCPASELQATNQAQAREIENLRGEMEAMRWQLKQNSEEEADLVRFDNMLWDKHKQVVREYGRLHQKQRQLVTRQSRLQEERSALEQQHESLQQNHGCLQEKNQSLEEKQSHLQQKHANLQENHVRLQQDRDQLFREDITLRQQRSSLEKQRDQLREELSQLRQQFCWQYNERVLQQGPWYNATTGTHGYSGYNAYTWPNAYPRPSASSNAPNTYMPPYTAGPPAPPFR